MSHQQTIRKLVRCCVWIGLLLMATPVAAQVKSYTVRDGKMIIRLEKNISEPALDSFIVQFDLKDLGLKQFIRQHVADSLLRQGWKIMSEDEIAIMISKSLEAFDNFDHPINKILLTEKHEDLAARFPAVSSRISFGYNRFRNKQSFLITDSIVRFYLRDYTRAEKVYLAGSFNDWSPTAQSMKKTDSGWIAYVRLAPGKYWYKFVVDGQWMVDQDNQLRENDGFGNINSVFFRTNRIFSLDGFEDARNVYLAGSFNGWKPRDLKMEKTTSGWVLPLYLAEGTHMYKFVVDGKWHADPANSLQVPDGAGGFNSMITIGKPYLFRLKGFEQAKKVMLAGSFNNWRDFELPMQKKDDGWELPFVLGAGNYEYKFIVDGKWISDPANPMTPGKDQNSFLILEPNHTFRLKGFEDAKAVYVAGDFNGWNPMAFPMRRKDGEWLFDLHLPVGKSRYKFIVDGKWILDPDNKLWEQNEYGTGNSFIWLGSDHSPESR